MAWDGDRTIVNVLHIDEALPEQRLAAAVLINAVHDAVGTRAWSVDTEDALDFLTSPARCLRPWIAAVCGDREPGDVQAALVERVRRDRKRAGKAWRQLVIAGCG